MSKIQSVAFVSFDDLLGSKDLDKAELFDSVSYGDAKHTLITTNQMVLCLSRLDETPSWRRCLTAVADLPEGTLIDIE